MNAIVKDVMTTTVVAVRRGATFKEMAVRLRQHRVSAFPVVDDDGKVVGIVSEADMLAKEALNGERAALSAPCCRTGNALRPMASLRAT